MAHRDGLIVKITEGPHKGQVGTIKGRSGKTYVVQTNKGTYYIHENHLTPA